MRRNLLFVFALLGISLQAQQNQLLEADFWKINPDINAVKQAVATGNSASQFNDNTFDPVTLAINNKMPLATVQYLLEQPGNSVDKITHDGRIYLHWAAMSGNAEIVKYLIAKGSDVNKGDARGNTPLVFGASAGMNNKEIYEMFFKAGVDPKKKYGNGQTILHIAIAGDQNLEFTNYLISKGLSLKDVDVKGSTVFDYAASMGNIELLKKIQAQGIKATQQALINASQGTRRTSNGLNVFQYLIDDVKLDPKTTNQEGANLLSVIARKPNQSEIIYYLISKGADANKLDENGNNALMIASGGKDMDNVKSLLAKTKDINIQNANGESALTQAFKSGSSEVVAYLLENKANPEVKDIKGNNLAYYVIQSYRPGSSATQGGSNNGTKKDDFAEKLNLLQSKGIDLKVPQADGNTVLLLAIAKNDLGLLKKLEPFKIDVNAKNAESMTALHKASLIAKDDQILKYLVGIGAKKDIKTEFEETAYDLASENEYLQKSKTSIEFLK
ncbi:Phosphocholine transferase AnkX [Chryseobacterium aquaeductus]|uniref:Phosphocholine transferase AnkX n=1 Tax=Chryseobacterium aquaeductus TaxID=2675056 RepID=A0A9N8QPI2_9FLAO|nr:ankyrin repeat domain-containing protein [Chryseobacterium aquaeductus]CAA7329531.1 Phosphocholine transferase AnkX [Chryseobacterium potabilaquae]CAD7797445.1 Phosphocholine transferase AnkX [Chryseobacterium aquaeductus]